MISALMDVFSGRTSDKRTSPPAAHTSPYRLPAEFSLEAHAVRGPEGDLSIVGSTNVPDGMKMWVYVGDSTLLLCDTCIYKNFVDGDVWIRNSKFETIALWEKIRNPYFTPQVAQFPDGLKLKFRRRPIPGGKYKVRFQAEFSSGWQEPDVLTMLGGEGGKTLHGKMFKTVNPDVIDSSKELDYTTIVEVPPLTPEAKAISLVKAARRVSTTLRHSDTEFREYFRLSFVVC